MKIELVCTAVETRCAREKWDFAGTLDGEPIAFQIHTDDIKSHGKFRKGNTYSASISETVSEENAAIDKARAKAQVKADKADAAQEKADAAQDNADAKAERKAAADNN